jgi:hypothetical protein
MAILSQRLMTDVGRSYYERFRIRPRFLDLSGNLLRAEDALNPLAQIRRRRSVALQESLDAGAPRIFGPLPGLTAWVVGMEDRRMVHGGVMGGGRCTCSRRSGRCWRTSVRGTATPPGGS